MEGNRSRRIQTTISNKNTPVSVPVSVSGGRPQSPHLIRSRGGGAVLTSNIISSSTPPPPPPPAEVPPLTPIHSFIRNSSTTKGIISPITKQRSRSATNSPSAWALSPGRTPPQSPMSRSLDKAIGSGSGGGVKVKSGGGAATAAAAEKVKSGGGMSVVLKYFRSNKKVSSMQEEAFHRYRVLHTRLVQWRLVNARDHNYNGSRPSFNVSKNVYR